MFPSLFGQINYGGPVPKSYYVRDSLKVTYDTSVSISRGSVFDLEYNITVPGSILRYAAAVSPPRLVLGPDQMSSTIAFIQSSKVGTTYIHKYDDVRECPP